MSDFMNEATMCSVEALREFVNERLTAAAEEIFRVFTKTIVEYQKEIDRQRTLLDLVWKPQVKLHRIDLLQQHVCNQNQNSSVDREDPDPPQIKEDREDPDPPQIKEDREDPDPPQIKEDREDPDPPQIKEDREDPDPPQIKEEQEELCSSQEEEQLELKLETETFMLIPANELSEPSEPQPEPESDHQLLYNNAHVAESRDQNRVKQEDSGSTGNVQKKPKKMHQKSKSHNNKVSNRNFQRNTSTGKKLIQCDTCGKYFKYKSELILHLRTHTGEKPFTCKTCGKSFRRRSHLKQHMGVHTREKAYSCNTCGEKFVHIRELNTHTRTHTDEKPHSCVTCGKGYIQIQSLKKHIEVVHTG